MIDVSKYEWLRTDIDLSSANVKESDVRTALSYIQKKNWEDVKKNAIFKYYFEELKAGNVPSFKNEKQMDKFMKDLVSSQAYVSMAQESTKKDKKDFTIYGIGMAFGFAAFLYCLFGGIRKDIPLDPTVSLVIAVVALAVTSWTYRKRYKIIEKYTNETNTFMLHDFMFVAIAILIKFIGKSVMDVTIILMGFDAYFTTKELSEIVEKVIK